MSLAKVYSRARLGLDSPLVTVEVHISNGLPAFSIVGLPETSVKEAKDRVRSALINCGYEFPAKRITVNLAPADLPKEGARFDLPIAIGILVASNQLPHNELEDYEFVGELALSGEMRPIVGEIPAALACKEYRRTLILPLANAAKAKWVHDSKLIAIEHLQQLYPHFARQSPLPLFSADINEEPNASFALDMCEVIGQPVAKRALEISASGSHNLLLLC